MPLFRQFETKPEKERVRKRRRKHGTNEEDGEYPSSLMRMCLLSVAENMKEVWVKDYAQNYIDQYFFRYIMGPFSLLPGDILEELVCILSSRNLLTRAALHLLLLPQLRALSLSACPNLVNSNLCTLIGTRCQSLQSLDLSDATNISAPVLCELLGSLPSLRSLSLAGTLSDRRVLMAVAQHCPRLRHLDVSRCLHLTPPDLLSIVQRPEGTRLLFSIRALDIGLEESEAAVVLSVAYLLLTQPSLQRLAMEGLGRACNLIASKEFWVAEDFASRRGMASLRDVWAERMQENERKGAEGTEMGHENFSFAEEKDEWFPKDVPREKTDERGGVQGQSDEKENVVILPLKEAHGVCFKTLTAVGKLCPDICALSINCQDEDDDDDNEEAQSGARLVQGLGRWSGQLRNLSMRFPGPLSELIPAAQSVGSTLTSLTLEGVKTNRDCPLMELIKACPKLTSLVILIEPPTSHQEEEEEEEEANDEDELSRLSCLPQLRCVTLNFALDEQQMRPFMSLRHLKGALWALLRGSVLLEKLSLIAVPCPLDPVFRLVLDHNAKPLGTPDSPPLMRLKHVNLNRSDISVETVSRFVTADNRLSTLDLSGCWAISLRDITNLQNKVKKRRCNLHIAWN
ncbi:uncharacterized protein LOC115828018 isoform X2 [Chanos chanos]|uniref:Uncharacterized protein LOC115828018 isoform X2 n=1 Tax=Chanos chanos TaxID=29144 RepID=A0A6J2WU12_CHACN|nr:uncharacterized protein LOC115828018 isoform X2 [Chanos chanos]